MEKCNNYIECGHSNRYGYCKATKNHGLCDCLGNISKCNYYPEKRNNKMNTLEMLNVAQKTGKTYKAKDMLYNTTLGFHDSGKHPWPADAFYDLNDLFSINNWQEDNTIYMTKSEAEKKYGIKIVGD